jgi:hypothetical protein
MARLDGRLNLVELSGIGPALATTVQASRKQKESGHNRRFNEESERSNVNRGKSAAGRADSKK